MTIPIIDGRPNTEMNNIKNVIPWITTFQHTNVTGVIVYLLNVGSSQNFYDSY